MSPFEIRRPGACSFSSLAFTVLLLCTDYCVKYFIFILISRFPYFLGRGVESDIQIKQGNTVWEGQTANREITGEEEGTSI